MSPAVSSRATSPLLPAPNGAGKACFRSEGAASLAARFPRLGECLGRALVNHSFRPLRNLHPRGPPRAIEKIGNNRIVIRNSSIVQSFVEQNAPILKCDIFLVPFQFAFKFSCYFKIGTRRPSHLVRL